MGLPFGVIGCTIKLNYYHFPLMSPVVNFR
jgi:hypothetical protein